MHKSLPFFIALLLMSSYTNVQEIPVNELLGKFNPATHPDFIKIDDEYTSKSDIYLRKEAYKAFKNMYWDAKKCGIELQIKSATRNFNYQKGIWERKFKRPKYKGWDEIEIVKDIMKYSSMPGTSRHHWGTDIDLNALENSYFEHGEGKRTYEWLRDFGTEYGFYQVYTSKEDGRAGYEEEKWHWTYLPSSKAYLIQYLSTVTYEDIKGFSGSEQAKNIGAIENYVGGVNPKILK